MTAGAPNDRDAKLRTLVGYGVKRANSAIMGDVERVLGRFGLRRTTFSALSVISGNAGIRQSDLAEVLAIERPNLVQIVDELLRSGLVERARDAADRRAYLLTAMAQGEALLAEAGGALHAYDARLTKGMSAAERAALISALRRVEETASEIGGAEAWEGRDVGTISTS